MRTALKLHTPDHRGIYPMPRLLALLDAARRAGAAYSATGEPAAIFFLSAVCFDERALGAELLPRLGVSRATMRALAEPAVIAARLGAALGNGPSLDAVIERAAWVARDWGMQRIDTGHMLIALFQMDGAALRTLLGSELRAPARPRAEVPSGAAAQVSAA